MTVIISRPDSKILSLLLGCLASLLPLAASAAVTQPDGTVMPKASPAEEVSLQELFDFKEGAGEIDAIADASTQPATFRPLCDFTAQLLLHETGNKTGAVGWYNSPADDVPPTTVCDEATGMSSGGGPCTDKDIFQLIAGNVAEPPFGRAAQPLENPGQIFTGKDIATSPFYAGGEIGFALLTQQRHYSELRLNPACVGTTCTHGDRWIPTIMYASKNTPRGFYMCSEDQTVGPTEWGGNDGDFNDYVFLFTGLVCSGSGETCDTGQPGVCAAGLTDCADASGESSCRPARSPSDESCNGLDDDCNGDTDEGEDLCPTGEICVKARCVPVCGTGEFRCPADQQCIEGACIESVCVDVKCAAGQVCMAGECVGACDDVICPRGQTCADGLCIDPCQGIDCDEGFICEAGACLVECSCAGCASGECDTATGHCVDQGCAGVTCEQGQHCVTGECVDACIDVQCPNGGECISGQCLAPDNFSDGVGGAPPDPGIDLGNGNESGAGGTGSVAVAGSSAGGTAGDDGTGLTNGNDYRKADPGCACSTPAGSSRSTGALLLAAATALLFTRRRRQNYAG
jgi:MYXO-CTERM domain-containing protein